MKPIFALLAVYSGAALAEDAAPLLAKARAAFVANHAQERYWIWTSVSTRSILDKAGKTLETLPSVTIESPIRSDGKRCNAVVAWGDGVEPYLKNANADDRCKVAEEVPAVVQMEAVLAADHAKLKARSSDEITLEIHPARHADESADDAKRCADSLEGAIGLDPETYFPKRVDLTVVTSGCEQKSAEFEEHYEGSVVKAAGGYRKGARLQYEYALQKDRTGNASRNFWIAVHRSIRQPFQKHAVAVMISGRRFMLSSKGPDRQGVTEVTATASEISAESSLKFDIPK